MSFAPFCRLALDGRAVTEPKPRDKPRRRLPEDPNALQVVSYLWAEYQYRHDMVWKLAFRITAVAAALLIAPFLADESVQKAVRWGLLGLPALALVVILGGLLTLESELPRLDLIRKAYRKAQFEVLNPYVSANELEQGRVKLDEPEKPDEPKADRQPNEPSRWDRLLGSVGARWDRLLGWFGERPFDQRVRLYCYGLLVAAIIYVVLLAWLWLPDLVD